MNVITGCHETLGYAAIVVLGDMHIMCESMLKLYWHVRMRIVRNK